MKALQMLKYEFFNIWTQNGNVIYNFQRLFEFYQVFEEEIHLKMPIKMLKGDKINVFIKKISKISLFLKKRLKRKFMPMNLK